MNAKKDLLKTKKEKDSLTEQRLLKIIETIYDQFAREQIPQLLIPTRTKSNIELHDRIPKKTTRREPLVNAQGALLHL
jgi:DNA topoisomerase VI subunit A